MTEPESGLETLLVKQPEVAPARRKRGRPPKSESEAHITIEEDENPRRRKKGKLFRPKCFTIADEDTLERIVYPPPKPEPEFSGNDYVAGFKAEVKVLFMCNEPNCTAKFTTSTALTLHGNKHLNRQYRCTFCNMLFKTNQDMDNHLKEYHPDLTKDPDANPLKCKKCNRICRDQRALWRHVRESHRDRNYPCPQCNFPFTRPENLKEHLKLKHPPKDQQEDLRQICRTCGKKFTHRNTLLTHIREKHRGKGRSFRCVICNLIYNCKHSYTAHMKRHIDPIFFHCEICKVKFRSISHLKRHQSSDRHHQVERQVKLKKIDTTTVPVIKTVKTANSDLSQEELIKLCRETIVKIDLHRVDEHIVTQNEKEEEEQTDEESSNQNLYLNCLYCDLEFTNLEAVKSHEIACFMKIRSKKLHICSVCNKEFDCPHRFKNHCRTHTDERPFPCSYCNATFKCRQTKIQHEKAVHFGIRHDPYKNARVYKCNQDGCTKEYRNPKGVKRHVEAHHLKVRFTCEKCPRSYQRLKKLNDHVKREHSESETPVIRLECKPCNRTYVNKATYLSHLEKPRHGRKVEEYEEKKFRETKKKNKKVF